MKDSSSTSSQADGQPIEVSWTHHPNVRCVRAVLREHRKGHEVTAVDQVQAEGVERQVVGAAGPHPDAQVQWQAFIRRDHTLSSCRLLWRSAALLVLCPLHKPCTPSKQPFVHGLVMGRY